jgi:hypothetical protein
MFWILLLVGVWTMYFGSSGGNIDLLVLGAAITLLAGKFNKEEPDEHV